MRTTDSLALFVCCACVAPVIHCSGASSDAPPPAPAVRPTATESSAPAVTAAATDAGALANAQAGSQGSEERDAGAATPSICSNAGSELVHFTWPDIPGFACGAKELAWPDINQWRYFYSGNLCAGGERIYRIAWEMKISPQAEVGAGVYVPADDKYWEPFLGVNHVRCTEDGFCGIGYEDPIHPSLLRNWDPKLWMIPLRQGKYKMLACIPDRGRVERIFRVQARLNNEVIVDCCVHFDSTFPPKPKRPKKKHPHPGRQTTSRRG